MPHGDERCPTVIQHEGFLGEMRSDIKHIKNKVDNGLTEQMRETIAALAEARQHFETQLVIIKEENWFSRILSGSAKKIIGYVVGIILLSGISTTAMWSTYKSWRFQEYPGQQAAILNAQVSDMHHHELPNGDTVFHANDKNIPAWILYNDTKKWDRCPQYRTDEGLLPTGAIK